VRPQFQSNKLDATSDNFEEDDNESSTDLPETQVQDLQEEIIKVEVMEDDQPNDIDNGDYPDGNGGDDDVQPFPEPKPSKRGRYKRKPRKWLVVDSDFEEDDSDQDDFKPDGDEDDDNPYKKKSGSSRYSHDVVWTKVVTYYNIPLHKTTKTDKYKCSECDSILPNLRSRMRNHVIKFHTELFACPHCSKRFEAPSNLQKHVESCLNPKQVAASKTCEICGRPFLTLESIKKHRWTHYSEQEKEEAFNRGEKMPLNRARAFECDQDGCKAGFRNKVLLDEHLKTRHFQVETREEKEKQLCGVCGVTVINLRSHMANKHKPVEERKFECGVCKKRFIYQSQLTEHRKQTHESGGSNWTCQVCGKQVKSEQNLKRHELMHELVKPFGCHLCGKGFTKMKVLNEHIKKHEKEKTNAKKRKRKGVKLEAI